MKINSNYLNLKDSYLFSDIAKKAKAYSVAHPDRKVIRMGIGDVTLPLSSVVAKAMEEASLKMSRKETFRGYGEEQGYKFLRDAIVQYYHTKGVTVDREEVFVSDGAKSDLGNLLDIFSVDNTVLVPDPVYPVYVDTNMMAGRKIIYTQGNWDNSFLPLPQKGVKADLIYLCSPNNPTGAVYDAERLKLWVDYALQQDAVILFDAAYESFVQDQTLPTSIYQIPGAKECAIEVCSFSKTAGFTGVRCGYTVVPKELKRENAVLNSLWLRRQTTKFNGVSYIVQCGAAAVFTEEGFHQTRESIAYYLENAGIVTKALEKAGIEYTGGKNAPYIWLKCPRGLKSWEYFDLLLDKAAVIGTPGAGFGQNGEGYFRLTAFGDRENVIEGISRLISL
ncbi:MAG: LL-diaminopimelate aminotransferase [Christensenellales bacterium]